VGLYHEDPPNWYPVYRIQTLLAQPVFLAATLRKSSGNLASNSKPILAEAPAIRLKNSENDHSFRPTAVEPKRIEETVKLSG
jgi:hypothetical protein